MTKKNLKNVIYLNKMSLNDINIQYINKIITPYDLKKIIKIDNKIKNNIIKWRSEISKIIDGKDQRKIMIVGPCSIHDEQIALEFANHLLDVKNRYRNKIFIIMRVYFEKPRNNYRMERFNK